jgi:hypothetical protein
MIDWDASAELNGCSVGWLKERFVVFPKSNKRIAVICDMCGKDSETTFSQYRGMCNHCSVSTPDAIEANRMRGVERCNTPEYRKKMSETATQYHKKHPEQARNHSRWMLQHFVDNPSAGQQHSASLQGQDYDAGEWTGYARDKDWREWDKAIFINEPFQGCHRHHITKTIVACIPKELHNHIPHTLKTGVNMGEMNALAIQFINGGLEL